MDRRRSYWRLENVKKVRVEHVRHFTLHAEAVASVSESTAIIFYNLVQEIHCIYEHAAVLRQRANVQTFQQHFSSILTHASSTYTYLIGLLPKHLGCYSEFSLERETLSNGWIQIGIFEEARFVLSRNPERS